LTTLRGLAVLLLLTAALAAQAMSTAFSYQGRLQNADGALTGTFDLKFGVYNAATAGTQVGNALTVPGVTVTNGLFNTWLDFGAGVFTGPDRWLEIAVSPAGADTYTTLTPRQALTATPYALCALNSADAVPLPSEAGVPDGVRAYLALTGVAGDLSSTTYTNWIHITDWKDMLTVKGGIVSIGKVSISTIKLWKRVDLVTPTLFIYACNGRQIAEGGIVLTTVIAGQERPFMTFKLAEVLVDGQVMGRQYEQVSLAFSEITIEVLTYDANGVQTGRVHNGWDIAKNIEL
jgi:type VI protein secretion system component Hcp